MSNNGVEPQPNGAVNQAGGSVNQPGGAVNQPKGTTVCGIIGLVLGGVAALTCFIPLINNISFVLGAVGLVLSIIGLVGTRRGKKSGKALAIVATVLCVISLIVTLWVQKSISDAFDEAGKAFETNQSTSGESDQAGNDGDSSDQAQSDDKDAQGSAKNVQDMEGDLSESHVKIVSAVKEGADVDGKPTVVVTYEWTNKSDENQSFMGLMHSEVFQNGNQLESALITDDSAGSYDVKSEMQNLQPGAKGTATQAFVLKDDSELTVEVSDMFSTSKAKVVGKFNMEG
ncbi:DUF5067 domain-containing protein [Gleimia hominis]|uniref:DUF5067 domain-containing protein n=1 Tax=Gleimia hominis TaxID=595468 RepID=A0ABU3IA71_9ACTO|nr:DUF5067 domain-containing protein [Gleimia hominis]MDT3767279.1 DUF5067 domain-containing protein [Gleimia hominis]